MTQSQDDVSVGSAPAAAPGSAQEMAGRFFKRNFTCHLLDGVFAVAAFSLMGMDTIMPGLVSQLVERAGVLKPYENRLASLLGIAFWSLSAITSFMFAGHFEARSRRKPLWLGFVFAARFAFVLLVLATVAMPVIGVVPYVVVFYLCLTWYALFSGASNPQWLDFIGRQIPANRRGVLFGVRDAIGTGAGIALMAAFPWISRLAGFPYNYAWLFAAVGVLMAFSFAALASTREIPYDAIHLRPRLPLPRQIRQLIGIFFLDRAYGRMMLAFLILGLAGIGGQFLYTLKGIKVLHIDTPQAKAEFTALATICSMAGYALSMPLSGLLGDRWGYKRLAYVAYGLLIASLLVALGAQTKIMFMAAIALANMARSGMTLVNLNFALELAPENRRTSYMAAKSLAALPLLLVSMAGGWLADWWGYEAPFIAAAVFIVFGLIFLWRCVAEPRHASGHVTAVVAPQAPPEEAGSAISAGDGENR